MKLVAEILTGSLFYVEVGEDATVGDLKTEAANQENLPRDRLILMLDANNERFLLDNDEVPLKDYGVQDGSHIYVFFHPLDEGSSVSPSTLKESASGEPSPSTDLPTEPPNEENENEPENEDELSSEASDDELSNEAKEDVPLNEANEVNDENEQENEDETSNEPNDDVPPNEANEINDENEDEVPNEANDDVPPDEANEDEPPNEANDPSD